MQWQVNAIQWHAVASDCDTYLPDALPRLADCVPHVHPAQLALEDGVTPHLRVQGVQLLAGQRQLPLPFTVPDRERDTEPGRLRSCVDKLVPKNKGNIRASKRGSCTHPQNAATS